MLASDVKVSVIIPTSGREDLLKRALTSLVNSDMPPNEVIVVADSSLSGAPQYLETIRSEFDNKLRGLICLQSIGPRGASATRNAGMSVASGDFIAFLDDDDEFLPHKLKTQIQAMVRTGANFSFTDYYRVSNSVSTYAECAPKPKHKGNLAREIAFDDCRIATPTVIVKRKFVENLLPLFPEEMSTHEDQYAWLRIALSPGFNSVYLGQALVTVHLAEGSVQRPKSKEGSKKGPLIPLHEMSLIALATSSGLKAPYLHTTRRTILKFLVTNFHLLKKFLKF
jgi:glycosyltransferase involved in cell wall biosynthesis